MIQFKHLERCASRGSTVRLVIGRTMLNAGIGTLLGLTGAWATQRLVRGFLFQISPVDPSTFVISAILLLLVAKIASGIPAARATRVDPAQLLRQE